uniref:Hydroxymethylglutaryl-CoA synthase n=1 Tax=Rhabditophanes sp. KR3021 TaxID=114890 RepID=A0AC35TQC1_9BILA
MSDAINVGIRALELYFPKNFVDQTEFEKFNGETNPGKYTIGFGQLKMGFYCDHEDINSICLTVTNNLLEKNEIDKNSIGFLAVGTETIIDKSKSVKTVLMRLFGENTDIEGVDVKNACYGGTQALFHAVDWVRANWESEKRYAIAVMADIAIYANGPARPTGGAGAFAVLIGPDAPFVVEKGLRATFMEDVYDFYKPIGGVASDFPVVNGPLSLSAYSKALKNTYKKYQEKAKRIIKEDVSLDSFDSVMFHSPFVRSVQKNLGLLAYSDYLNGKTNKLVDPQNFSQFTKMSDQDLHGNANFTKVSLASSINLWQEKTAPNTCFNQLIGNMYTPSLYGQLVSRIGRIEGPLQHNLRFLLFSYGSGCASTMFSMISNTCADKEILEKMKASCQDAVKRLDQRTKVSPEVYTQKLDERDILNQGILPYVPKSVNNEQLTNLFPGTFYLTDVDAKFRRSYAFHS